MLYRLTQNGHSRYKYAWKDISFLGWDESQCPVCGRATVQMQYAPSEHILCVEGGKVWPDFLSFCGAGKRLLLLSERAAALFSSSHITGISGMEPVAIQDVRNSGALEEERPKYFHVELCGKIDFSFDEMKLKKKRLCCECGQFEWNRQRIPPIVVAEDSWNGCDLCSVVSMPGYIICSERVTEIVKSNKLTGFAFEAVPTKKE